MSERKAVDSYCIGCGRIYAIESFNKSTNKFHRNGVLPYCKTCCIDMSHKYLKKTGSLQAAIWYCCANLGVPFIYNAYKKTEETISKREKAPSKTFNYVGTYLSSLQSLRRRVDKWEDFTDTNIGFEDVSGVQKIELQISESEAQLETDWGKHVVEEYSYLENKYNIYTSHIDIITPAQETLYRQLCLVELTKKKKDEHNAAEEKPDGLVDTNREQTQIITLMSKLKIDNFASSEVDLMSRQIEAKIFEVELNEPAEYFEDKYRHEDFMGLGVYFQNHVVRPLKNLLLGSKEYTLVEEYDENIEKATLNLEEKKEAGGE